MRRAFSKQINRANLILPPDWNDSVFGPGITFSIPSPKGSSRKAGYCHTLRMPSVHTDVNSSADSTLCWKRTDGIFPKGQFRICFFHSRLRTTMKRLENRAQDGNRADGFE